MKVLVLLLSITLVAGVVGWNLSGTWVQILTFVFLALAACLIVSNVVSSARRGVKYDHSAVAPLWVRCCMAVVFGLVLGKLLWLFPMIQAFA